VEAIMILGPVFEQFVKESPLSVMARATIEYALPAALLDSLFERTAERGYTKELLFSTTVDLLSLVVCGRVPHVQAAFKRISERVPVTLKCVYEKLQHLENEVSAEMVRSVAGRCQELISELGGQCQALLPGYRVRILDGNHLAATQKRLKVARGHSAGVLPGQSLSVLDPALMLVTEVIPCEDAHTQERALIGRVLPLVQEKDVWIEDRNFCTVDFLLGVKKRRAYFVVRRHGNLSVEMIALPPGQWEVFGRMSAKELASYLRDWASKINLEKIKKAPPRKPTKEKTKRIKDGSPHLSTARLLEEAKKDRLAKPKALH
jgi:hypothetical protein